MLGIWGRKCSLRLKELFDVRSVIQWFWWIYFGHTEGCVWWIRKKIIIPSWWKYFPSMSIFCTEKRVFSHFLICFRKKSHWKSSGLADELFECPWTAGWKLRLMFLVLRGLKRNPEKRIQRERMMSEIRKERLTDLSEFFYDESTFQWILR